MRIWYTGKKIEIAGIITAFLSFFTLQCVTRNENLILSMFNQSKLALKNFLYRLY